MPIVGLVFSIKGLQRKDLGHGSFAWAGLIMSILMTLFLILWIWLVVFVGFSTSSSTRDTELQNEGFIEWLNEDELNSN